MVIAMISNVYEAHPVCHKDVKQLNALSHLNLTAIQCDDDDDDDSSYCFLSTFYNTCGLITVPNIL